MRDRQVRQFLRCPPARAGFLLPVIALASMPASAIVVRDDLAECEPLERAMAPEFAGVGVLIAADGPRGCGTLIADRWIVTAAHVADEADVDEWMFVLGERFYEVVDVAVHPRWTGDLDGGGDLALMRLAEPARGVAPVPTLRFDAPVATPVEILGYGWTGDGRSGVTDVADRLRAATNTVEGWSGDAMLLIFDAPDTPFATPLEGMAAFNDSGGPVLVETPEGLRVAGVHSFIEDTNGNGVIADYGDAHGATRLAPYAPWIVMVMSACPADLDAGGDVHFADMLAVLAVWGPCPGCAEDLDGNGVVNIGDLIAVFAAWGPCEADSPLPVDR